MRVKKFKKVQNLKKSDVVIATIGDQQDSGVYSDITNPNVISIVDKVTEKNGVVTILTNGGYEYMYPKGTLFAFLGTFDSLTEDMDMFHDALEENPGLSRKELNKVVKEVNLVHDESKVDAFLEELETTFRKDSFGL